MHLNFIDGCFGNACGIDCISNFTGSVVYPVGEEKPIRKVTPNIKPTFYYTPVSGKAPTPIHRILLSDLINYILGSTGIYSSNITFIVNACRAIPPGLPRTAVDSMRQASGVDPE
jgi:hypothetical protein